MRILTFTTLYPNEATPLHGVFVENRLRHLVAQGEVEARVIAPVPWFPSSSERFGRYAAFARAPRRERRFGLEIAHPRYLLLPKIGMLLAPLGLYATARHEAQRLLAAGWDFDLIDAHYFYPDGVAAVLLARHFRRPVVITARGSDLTQLARHALPRAMIAWAAARADGLVTVSGGLSDELASLGVDPGRVKRLRNGVDLRLFKPIDREVARRELGLGGPVLASVGLLIPRKGHDIAIEALVALPGFTLLIVGEGPERATLQAIAERAGVAERVRFLGAVPHERLAEIYGAADALILASSREGWANVLLESMACGTPVVASDIPGTREVLAAPEAGILMAQRSAPGLAAACRQLFSALPERAATRAYAERFSWDDTSAGQLSLFREILAQAPAAVVGTTAAHNRVLG